MNMWSQNQTRYVDSTVQNMKQKKISKIFRGWVGRLRYLGFSFNDLGFGFGFQRFSKGLGGWRWSWEEEFGFEIVAQCYIWNLGMICSSQWKKMHMRLVYTTSTTLLQIDSWSLMSFLEGVYAYI